MFPLSDTKTQGTFPFMTFLLIVINVIVFVIELTSTNLETFISNYALTPALVDLSNFESLIPFATAIFLHGGFIHIISNMWFLWVFGDNIEQRMGIFYPVFFILGGIIGNVLQYVFEPTSAIPVLGASGAVAAILGAYLVLFPTHKIKTLVIFLGIITIIQIPASLMLIYWLITQFFNGAVSIGATSLEGGVAWFAHIGGFITGFIIAQFFKKTTYNFNE